MLASAALQGFGLGGGLIIAIGAQNAYVLRQGLKREHVFAVASICFLCDFALIAVGVAGFGELVAAFPALTATAAWGGAAFLGWYGLRSFRAAIHPDVVRTESAPAARGGRAAMTTALALSLLNPHVYLDTVVLTPLFRRPAAWRLLDIAIGVVMWSIATVLVYDQLTATPGT